MIDFNIVPQRKEKRMSLSLVEALEHVDLEPGRVYVCEVKGHKVELRVLKPAESRMPSAFDESDVMLDPWVEFPRPTSGIFLRAKSGSIPLPDVPELPVDEEDV
jgi:hypothetical protein